jgi:hypothetical protein
MPIVSSDLKYRLSGGAANSDPALSLGGAKSSVDAPLNLFDDVSSSEALSGDTEYRCFYIHNNHGTLTLQSAVAWVQSNTPSVDTDVAIGLGTSSINGTEQTVANENTAPSGVSFSAPTSKGTGLSIGNIPAGQHKAIWVRRTAAPNSQAYNNDTFTLRVEGDTAA